MTVTLVPPVGGPVEPPVGSPVRGRVEGRVEDQVEGRVEGPVGSPVGSPRGGPVRRSGTAPAGRAARPARPAGLLIFLAATAGYLAAGTWLASRGAVNPAALSRTLSAYYSLFGREPRLAGMGFGWPPLPVLAQLPLVPLARLAPGAAAAGLAGVVVSAGFTAASVVRLRSLLAFLGCPGWVAGGLAAGYAVNPEIVFLAATGSDQPIWIFFLILAAAGLARWVFTDNPGALAGCGLALAGAYLCRAEAAGAALAVLVVVVLCSLRRGPGPPAERRSRAVADTLVLLLPPAAAALVWSLVGWVVTGHVPPATTVAPDRILQLPGSAALAGDWLQRSWGSARAALDLMPVLPVVLAAAILLALATRRRWTLTALAPALGGWAFAAAELAAGGRFALLEFSAAAVPAGVLAAGVLAGTPGRRGENFTAATPSVPDPVFGVIAVVAVLLAVPVGVRTVLLDSRGPLEANHLTPALSPTRATAEQRQVLLRVRQDRALAAWLDSRRLPAGSVAVDPGDGYGVMLASGRPKQFLASTGSDFAARVAAPRRSGVRYLVTRGPAWGTAADAVSGVLAGPARRQFRFLREMPNPGDLPTWQVHTLR